MKNNLLRHASILLLSLISTLTIAQDIQQQYQDLYNKSSTWEDYKVIKLNSLTDFWSVVTDTLNQKQRAINEGKSEITSLNAKIDQLQTELASTQEALESSNSLNGSIGFLGMEVSKTGYNIFVWIIIAALAIGIGAVFMLFQRSNAVTTQTKKTFKELEREYNAHKEKARETQIRLKRELQTALNALNEQKVS